jgi:hypothetical protein
MSSTTFGYPQAISRAFASFRVARFSVSGAQRDFWRGSIPGSFTNKGPGQGKISQPGPFCINASIVRNRTLIADKQPQRHGDAIRLDVSASWGSGTQMARGLPLKTDKRL